MENKRMARELVKLAKKLIRADKELDTLYGKSAISLLDLDKAIRTNREIDNAAKKKLLKFMGDTIDAHDKLGDELTELWW